MRSRGRSISFVRSVTTRSAQPGFELRNLYLRSGACMFNVEIAANLLSEAIIVSLSPLTHGVSVADTAVGLNRLGNTGSLTGAVERMPIAHAAHNDFAPSDLVQASVTAR